MSDIGVRLATLEDVDYIGDNMRSTDVAELQAARGRDADVKEILNRVYKYAESDCHIWYGADGVPFAMWGFIQMPSTPTTGIPWLLGTDDVSKYTRPFLKASKKAVAEALSRFGYLFNYVHDANEPSKRYLEAIGFTLGEPELFGVCGEFFRKFEAGDSQVCVAQVV